MRRPRNACPNSSDYLRITAAGFSHGGTNAALTWISTLTRFYHIEEALNLNGGTNWIESSLGLISPDGATTARSFTDTNAPVRFYRVRAGLPLSP